MSDAGGGTSEGQGGGGLAVAARGLQASEHLNAAVGQAGVGRRRPEVPASDLLPPIRSGEPLAVSDALGSSWRLSRCCLPWGDTPVGGLMGQLDTG